MHLVTETLAAALDLVGMFDSADRVRQGAAGASELVDLEQAVHAWARDCRDPAWGSALAEMGFYSHHCDAIAI